MLTIRQSEVQAKFRLKEALYEELVKCLSKVILFICTHCCWKGSIMKCMMRHENDLRQAQSDSTRLLE